MACKSTMALQLAAQAFPLATVVSRDWVLPLVRAVCYFPHTP